MGRKGVNALACKMQGQTSLSGANALIKRTTTNPLEGGFLYARKQLPMIHSEPLIGNRLDTLAVDRHRAGR